MTMTSGDGYMLGLPSLILNGTGTLTANTTALTGAGSAFNTELKIGDVITAAGQVLAIAAVKDADEATLQTAPNPPLSGAAFTITPLYTLRNLTVSVTFPRSSFKQWQSKIMLGNGLARGVGRPSCSWQWGFVTAAQYDQLRAYVAGASTRVYIRTRTTETNDSYKVYTASGIWPDEVNRDATRRVGFTIEFKDLVLL